MSDPTSVDFLGQKRRVRPVRKVQVSTHFDELNLVPNDEGTPDPPGLNENIIKEIATVPMSSDVPIPEPRQAIYAGKFPSPPAELNTLVPEDFNFMDFNFKALKSKTNVNEIIKSDHTFESIETSKQKELSEPIINDSVAKPELVESKGSESKKTEDNTEIDKSLLVGAAVATTAAIATISAVVSEATEVKPIEKEAVQVESAKNRTTKSAILVPVIDEKPLVKVSDARKTLEATNEGEKSTAKNNSMVISTAAKSNPSQSDAAEKQCAAVIAGAAVVAAITATAASSDRSNETATKEDMTKTAEIVSDKPKEITVEEVAKAAVIVVASEQSKETVAKEVVAPPPLPTNNAHLVAVRESLKPSLLPVKPVSGAPSTDPAINAEALEKLKKQLDEHKLLLENEINAKKQLESQIQAMISKSNSQEEALRNENELMEQLHSDYLKINNDLTAAKSEKDRLKEALTKAESELKLTSESDAKAFLEKSDEITVLKDKLAELSAIVGQKNKEIDSLKRQLEEAKQCSIQNARENVQEYDTFEDELIKMVEEEILRMQITIDEQREYNVKLQTEVDSEYAYWKTKLAKH